MHIHNIIFSELLSYFKQMSNISTICSQVIQKNELILLTERRCFIFTYFRNPCTLHAPLTNGFIDSWIPDLHIDAKYMPSPNTLFTVHSKFNIEIQQIMDNRSLRTFSWFHDTDVFKHVSQVNKFSPPWIAELGFQYIDQGSTQRSRSVEQPVGWTAGRF